MAQAASLIKFKTRLKFLRHLDALGPTEDWLEGVPPGKVAHFAGEAKVTDVADLRKVLAEDKRLRLIISLLHTVRTSTRDEVVTMFCKRMAAIHKKGRDQLEALCEAHRAESERRGGQASLYGVGAQTLVAARGEGFGDRVHTGTGQQVQLPGLGALVAADEIGGDAVQPGQGVVPGQVIAAALAEGSEKGLRHHVLGDVESEAADDESLDFGRVSAEDLREHLGLLPGPRDDGGIVWARF